VRPEPSWRFRAIAAIVIGLLRLMRWRFAITGTSHVPREGGAVLAWNHTSHVDFLCVAYAVYRETGRPVRFMALRELFDHPVVGWVPRFVEALPVDRASTRGRGEALREAIDALAAGHLVMIAPEATISEAFDLLPFRTGAARMAELGDVPLLPAVSWGSHRLVTTGRPMGLRRAYRIPITVDIGAPIPREPGEASSIVTERLHRRMGELVEHAQESYEDGTPAGAWWVPARLGGSAPTVEEVVAEHRAARRPGRGA